MQLKLRSTMFAALSAAALFFAAAPAEAQGLVSIGRGSYKSPNNPEQTSHFAYYLSERRTGKVRGYAIWFFPKSTIVVRVTSYGFFKLTPNSDKESLAFAGPIVAVFGTPSGPNAVVGRTAYSAFNDNPDETAGFSVAPRPADLLAPPFNFPGVPPFLGDLTTIQQLFKLLQILGPFGTPRWAPLTRGNVWVR